MRQRHMFNSERHAYLYVPNPESRKLKYFPKPKCEKSPSEQAQEILQEADVEEAADTLHIGEQIIDILGEGALKTPGHRS